MTRVDLDADGYGWRVPVPRRHLAPGAFGDGYDVRHQQVGLGLVEHQLEVRRLDDSVVDEGVQQVEGVLEPEVEGIARERLLQVLPARLDPAQADLVEPHETPRGPAVGVGRAGVPREGERVLVLAVIGVQFGEQEEGCGGDRGGRADRFHGGAEALVVAGEVKDRRLRAERLQVGGVDLERALGFLQCLAAASSQQAQTGEQRPGADQIAVGGQRGLDRACRVAAPFETGDAGDAQQRARVGRVFGEDGLECLRRLARVVPLQKEFSDRQLRGVIARGRPRWPDRVPATRRARTRSPSGKGGSSPVPPR